jgi:hypothetical protein
MKRNQTEWITYLLLCWRWKWFILLCVAIGSGHGGYKLIKTPTFYEAEVSLMVLDPGMSGGGGGMGIANLMQLQGQSTSQEFTILNILQSRRMGEEITAHFDFEKRYKIDHPSAVRKAMGMIHASPFRKMIVIKTWGEERQLAIDLANFCVENLWRFNTSLGINSSKSWVQILDPPELSARVTGRQQQKRAMILETILGAVIGVVLVMGGHGFLELRKFILDSRYKD